MAKEWLLNQVLNRWRFNKENSVGPVTELIRKCAPKGPEEWERYYYGKVYSKEYLEGLGRKLYSKISEVVQFEVAEITEQDCIKCIKEEVINRTFKEYLTEEAGRVGKILLQKSLSKTKIKS